jgi:predicted signal transduction protein with EAL and GGDEF domain
VAKRLRETLPASDAAARLGGDEFAVLISQTTGEDEARQAARRLRDVICRPYVVNGVTVHLDASIGIALFPEHGPDVTTLLRFADVAMYEAKQQRTSVCVYDPAHDNHTAERLALADDLRTALADGSFGLGYQPVKRLGDNTIIGAEVLARWEHPTRGFLPPPTYIGVAERSDLIRILTSFVLGRALEQRRTWAANGFDLRVSVNVSVHDLYREGFARDVARLVQETGTPPGGLVLELTETQAMHHPERIAPILNEIRSSGVLVAIDDFGTGFSSLTSLRTLPIDEIKIDRSFVSRMTSNDHDNAIVRSLIELARRLHIEVVAEGVEDEETQQQLRELSCDKIQGYLISRALSADELEQWLDRRNERSTDGGNVPLLHRATSR